MVEVSSTEVVEAIGLKNLTQGVYSLRKDQEWKPRELFKSKLEEEPEYEIKEYVITHK